MIFAARSEIIFATSDTSDGNLAFNWGEEREVRAKRKIFLKKYGVQLEDCVVMDVEHEERIVAVGGADRGKMIEAEAFITRTKGVVLFLLTADCLPVALYDPFKRVIALLHLGWRPTNKKLLDKVLVQLARDFDSSPRDLLVSIGPGIHQKSYRFKDPVQKAMPGWEPFLIDFPDGETGIDLVGYNRQQLLDAGVRDENITINPHDTFTSPDYFSHTRSVRTGEPEGRFATILALK